ncbi:family 78 glycoside hydrolase catalytic domain [Fibrella forsythiae]|uniref:alpha-L-rhamnosidase n=1 Tax=Fibrella forsythiae TaxID=2817061 RepID=A0ABS3JD40_9BACT|nr:family 78 glycoside hydrolase catalytic domain [Fibrella forsythiae]MBO0947920.1 family 78 glycoside hydrolase catalytic domain [Fibrella forsythiae]
MKKLTFIFLLLLLSASAFSQSVSVTRLRCEYRANPVGVQTAKPVFSWQLGSTTRNTLQKAYRILIADSPAALSQQGGNVWDSGKVMVETSIQVSYGGKALESAKVYYWKIKVWDNHGAESPWSEVASWQMGLLTRADWKGAAWIGFDRLPDSLVDGLPTDGKKDVVQGGNVLPLLRKSFRVTKPVRQVTLFIAGLGQFDAHLNGQKIGDHFLDPGWTKYDKQAQYVAFDLTGRVKLGENALGVMLGNGFYYVPPVKDRFRKLKVMFGYPKLICQLLINYADGSAYTILSDDSWKTAPSPITFSSIYGGENYNATLEQSGWDSPAFEDATWRTAMVVDGPPRLGAQTQEPIKVFDTFSAVSKKRLDSGDWVYDLGQNASGIIRLTVQGKRGDTIRVYPAELLKADGAVNQKASGSPYYFEYILKGNVPETWQPRFTYYGFRYLQLKGGVPKGEQNPRNRPELSELVGLHTRNAAASAGTFTCSNELFNRANTLIDWGVKSNMASVFTDCPHREKLGWLEELHLMGSSVRYQYDIASLLKKEIQDMKDSQLPDGLIPEIAPEYVKFDYGNGIFRDSPEWGSSAIIVPWYLYQWYGEKAELADSYPMMQRYLTYLGTKASNHILAQGLGDWYDLGPKPPGVSQQTPMGVTGTAIYYYDLTIMAQIARMLNKPADADRYSELAKQVRIAFNQSFFNRETKQYATNSQTANAMALYMNLVDEPFREAVVGNIVQDIRRRNNSLTAGDIGYRYLLRALEAAGRSDVIFDMNSRADVPGYGYQLAQGATALTESWQALPTVSNNHFMLGHLMEWLYAGLAGIKQEETSVAFRNSVIYPQPVGDVTHTKATYNSPYGLITSEWTKTGTNFDLTVQIPPNTTSTIYLPAISAGQITESNAPIANSKAVRLAGFDKDRARIIVGSGTYRFRVKG